MPLLVKQLKHLEQKKQTNKKLVFNCPRPHISKSKIELVGVYIVICIIGYYANEIMCPCHICVNTRICANLNHVIQTPQSNDTLKRISNVFALTKCYNIHWAIVPQWYTYIYTYIRLHRYERFDPNFSNDRSQNFE